MTAIAIADLRIPRVNAYIMTNCPRIASPPSAGSVSNSAENQLAISTYHKDTKAQRAQRKGHIQHTILGVLGGKAFCISTEMDTQPFSGLARFHRAIQHQELMLRFAYRVLN